MGCLFGYVGKPDNKLLDRMGRLLRHRTYNGVERVVISRPDGAVVEIGRGVAPWTVGPHLFCDKARHIAFGHCGTLFRVPGASTSPAESSQEYSRHLPERFKGLADALQRDAARALTSLEGCFTAVCARGNELFLARDAAGVKALYWTRHRDRLLFASEIKALFADPDVPRRLRIGALPEYFTFSFVPGEGTMFEDVRELQPGTVLTYANGNVSVTRHFLFEGLEWDGKHRPPEQPFVDQMREDLEESVRECCTLSKNPPAVFLSGGIDSSAVLAVLANRLPDTRVKTFSIHFGKKYANENEYVSMMIDRYGTDHTWLEIQPKRFMRRMREIVWKLDDPIGDPITVPNYLISEEASKVTNLVLNGEGGDPVLGGPKNIPMLLAQLYGPLPGEASEDYLERNYLHSYRKCFSDLTHLLDPDVLRMSGGEDALLDIVRPFMKASSPKSFVNKLMSINIRLKGANLILVKVDKMSSANGILAMPPLFSKRVIENGMRCPAPYKLNGNVEKYVLKRAVADLVPAPILQRPKSGMMVPVRFWFQGEMRRYAKRVLSKRNLKQTGYFNADYARALLKYDKEEVQGARHGLKLWMLVTFMLWHERMVKSPSIEP